VKIIDAYVEAKKKMFDEFIKLCENLKLIKNLESDDISNFILEQLAPNVDARVFEIVSYSILKFFYHDITIFIGESKATITEKNLTLYKTGRTNANDGGIDFVMKPLGRFFQVTETLDFKKYFLDIDKVEKFPITFVIKSNDEITEISEKIRSKAKAQYGIEAIVEKYMDCIEEIINIPNLISKFEHAKSAGYLSEILDEILIQSKIEFNYEE